MAQGVNNWIAPQAVAGHLGIDLNPGGALERIEGLTRTALDFLGGYLQTPLLDAEITRIIPGGETSIKGSTAQVHVIDPIAQVSGGEIEAFYSISTGVSRTFMVTAAASGVGLVITPPVAGWPGVMGLSPSLRWTRGLPAEAPYKSQVQEAVIVLVRELWLGEAGEGVNNHTAYALVENYRMPEPMLRVVA